MRNIILIISCIVFSLNGFTQDNQDYFVIENSKVIWQKVYETTKTKEELTTYFKESGLFSSFEIGEGKLITELKDQVVDKKKGGVTGVPMAVLMYDYKGIVVIDLKENKYRVTLKVITLVLNINNPALAGRKGDEDSFEKLYLKKGTNQFKGWFPKKSGKVYNANYLDLFTVKEVKTNDDW
jgi:hypothetical protein